MNTKVLRTLILFALLAISTLLFTENAQAAVPTTHCGNDMLECPGMHAGTAETMDDETSETMDDETVPDNECGAYKESGPHPCPGGRGFGVQNGRMEQADPNPAPSAPEINAPSPKENHDAQTAQMRPL